MQTTIYSTFRDPETADRAFEELLRMGASLLDMAVVAQRSYLEPEIDESGFEKEHGCSESKADTIDQNGPLGLSTCLDPFEDRPCGIRLFDNLTYPGDLTSCLCVLGFAEEFAIETENAILEGSGLFIVRVPTGLVDKQTVLETLKKLGGTNLPPWALPA